MSTTPNPSAELQGGKSTVSKAPLEPQGPAVGTEKATDKGAKKEAAPAAMKKAMETLPKDHTYSDRVEAQARSLGIEVVEGETLEYLMWKIRMRASS